MERLLQYLDDLEDLAFAVASQAENIRRILRFVGFTLIAVLAQMLCVALAVTNPPLAAASASVLVVGMLYRSAVYNVPIASATS